MPKRMLPLIINPNYTQILLCLSEEPLNDLQVSKKLKKTYPNIRRQIYILKELDVLKEDNSINYNNITLEFIRYINNESEYTDDEQTRTGFVYRITRKIISEVPINEEAILKEEILQEILKNFFKYYTKKDQINQKIVIKNIFDDLINTIIIQNLMAETEQNEDLEHQENIKFFKQLEKYPETNEFITLKILMSYEILRIYDKIDILQETLNKRFEH